MDAIGPSFARRWIANFSRWDGDGNGQIDPHELYLQIGSEQSSSQDAAALATLYREVLHESHQLGEVPAVDKARLKSYLMQAQSRHLDVAFAAFQAKIAGQGEPLAQGQVPSCALVSTAYALDRRDPSALAAMVSSDSQRLEVKFPGLDQAISLSPLSDTERALHTTGLEAIEKAWGQRETSASQGSGSPIASARGNGVDRVIQAMTGHPAHTTLLPHPGLFAFLNATIQKKRPGAPELKPPALEPLLRSMEQALARQAIVVTGTWTQVTVPGLQPDHAYTVLDCDSQSQRIRLRNPHGQGEPGQDGANDGIFELSARDYVANFNSVTLEEVPTP